MLEAVVNLCSCVVAIIALLFYTIISSSLISSIISNIILLAYLEFCGQKFYISGPFFSLKIKIYYLLLKDNMAYKKYGCTLTIAQHCLF